MKDFFTLFNAADPFSLVAEVGKNAQGLTSNTQPLPALGFAILGLFALISLGLLVFWIIMFIRAARERYDNKAIWIALLLVGGWLAAIVFYVAVYRGLKRNKPETPSSA